MPGIYIETYGCQMNVSDSELMLGVLGREGYVRMDDPAQADVVLVNTCAVRDHAEQKVLRSEEHTSELQSPCNLVCRLLLEKKKKKINMYTMSLDYNIRIQNLNLLTT